MLMKTFFFLDLHETVRLPLPFSKSEAKRMFHAMMSTGDKNYLQLQDAAQLCDKSLRQVCFFLFLALSNY